MTPTLLIEALHLEIPQVPSFVSVIFPFIHDIDSRFPHTRSLSTELLDLLTAINREYNIFQFGKPETAFLARSYENGVQKSHPGHEEDANTRPSCARKPDDSVGPGVKLKVYTIYIRYRFSISSAKSMVVRKSYL